MPQRHNALGANLFLIQREHKYNTITSNIHMIIKTLSRYSVNLFKIYLDNITQTR